MKKIQGILTVVAFVVAIGGAFASSQMDILSVFRAPTSGGTCEVVSLPPNCGTDPGPICTLGINTYYQNKNAQGLCVNEYHFNN
ncbi:hypothetical protein GCM10007962_11470 [Yeosuana aromativorans]|uniref:Uncharacterized protein n=1 Tax=Yeosuana aromativorans TaxID=288019 RepID=A0A8J3BG62_9FLAO|nr:DUF6520 family protein [Yeosuana aromativorans]GGK18982.1 hypothetical protein GCM10007962_11470 [Yeosuana aromativorans]